MQENRWKVAIFSIDAPPYGFRLKAGMRSEGEGRSKKAGATGEASIVSDSLSPPHPALDAGSSTAVRRMTEGAATSCAPRTRLRLDGGSRPP